MHTLRITIALTLLFSVACTRFDATAGTPLSIEWEADCLPGYGYKAPLELPSGDILGALEVGGGRIWCYRSRNGGRTWSYLSEMVRDAASSTDIGDGHLMRLRDGTILYSFRHNNYVGLTQEQSIYRIQVIKSTNNGVSWTFHSDVAANQGLKDTQSGLWSSYLLERSDGVLQCYYDDEYTPAVSGFPGHQWASMKTWDPKAGQWVNRVTVSRAHNAAHLSRDGMCTVIETSPGHLVCAEESVQTAWPHAGVIRQVTSEDGGQTWSWQREERRIIYQPADTAFNVTAPWMIRLARGELFCLFTTDEDRVTPGQAYTGVLDLDLKYVLSDDNGATWQLDRKTLMPTSEALGQPWKFTTAAPATGWEQPGFSDAAWQQGTGGFGTQGTPGAVIGTPWQTSDIWLRRSFSLDQTPGRHIRLRLHHDEDTQVYINGVEALSVTGFTLGYKQYSISDQAVAAMKPGSNMIAMHCKQTGGGQYIDAGLVLPNNIADDHHPIYFCGVGELTQAGRANTLLAQYRRSGTKVLLGKIIRNESGALHWMGFE